MAEFSGGKGVQVSIRVPQMRQAAGFDAAIATQVLEAMRALAEW